MPNYNPARLARAFANYLPHAEACMREMPEHYSPQVLAAGAAENARNTFRVLHERGVRGLIIATSPSWKRTCKSLGIKHTYKAIEAWLSETEEEAFAKSRSALSTEAAGEPIA